jgi:hypothetical protein
MVTALTIITDALKEIGVLAEGDTMSGSMADDALRALNRICGIYSNDQAFAYTPSLSSLLLSGQSSFTVGPTGSVVADRPISIESAWVDRGGLSYPVKVIDSQQWDAIVYKGSSGSNTEVVWYEPTIPNGIIHVWPVCTGCTLNLRTINIVVSFANLSDVLTMPPAYEELLIKNLAVNIAPQYPACNLSPLTVRAAANARKVVGRTNNVIPRLKLPSSVQTQGRSSNLAAIMGGY